jgi:hypothetical protein
MKEFLATWFLIVNGIGMVYYGFTSFNWYETPAGSALVFCFGWFLIALALKDKIWKN